MVGQPKRRRVQSWQNNTPSFRGGGAEPGTQRRQASKRNGTLYLGVTSNLLQRGLEHREGRIDGFSRKHGCKTLVWWEQYGDMPSAIAREKDNPQWRDLYEDLLLPPQHKRFED